MGVELTSLVVILGMALATYATRAGGLLILGRVRPSPRLSAWLGHIPGSVLASIVAPVLLTTGPAEALAGLLTALVAWRTRSMPLAMVVGVASVWMLRPWLN
ncbi:MAG: AzlD domain-containing protein [Desulfarculaceae bacterium]|jgi:uncharacterized membrane protein